MSSTICLDHILAAAMPFDDVFDSEALRHDARVEPLPIWAHCGRRLDLQARTLTWQVLSLRAVVDDAHSTWAGWDDGAWDKGIEQL